jgi:hypothetical protein
MFALGILALIVFCILLSLRFSVLAYQNHVNSQSAEEKVVDLQQRIERLAVAPAAMERAETFRNNLSVLRSVYGVSIEANQLFTLLEAIKPQHIRLTKIDIDVRKGRVLMNAVSADSAELQQFVSALGSSVYLTDALITRKSRLQGSGGKQQYAIELAF